MRRILIAATLAVLLAGCGGSGRPHTSATRGVPQVLATDWASRASAVAVAAQSGNSCLALRLASSLRDDVVAARRRVPEGLRSALVTGVNALVDRFTCTPKATAPKGPPKNSKPRGHRHDHGDGPGNDQ